MRANIAASIDPTQFGGSLFQKGFFSEADIKECEMKNWDDIFRAVEARLDDDMNSLFLFVATLKNLNSELAEKLEKRANSEPLSWQSSPDNVNDVTNETTYRPGRNR